MIDMQGASKSTRIGGKRGAVNSRHSRHLFPS